MKKLMFSLIAAAMTVGTPAAANEAHHPDQGKPAAVQPGRDTSLPAASKDFTAGMERMDAMHRQMEQLRNTTDPQEREKLLREHLQAAHDTMAMMHGMDSDKDGVQMMKGERMDMMRMMMEQMPGREAATAGERK